MRVICQTVKKGPKVEIVKSMTFKIDSSHEIQLSASYLKVILSMAYAGVNLEVTELASYSTAAPEIKEPVVEPAPQPETPIEQPTATPEPQAEPERRGPGRPSKQK